MSSSEKDLGLVEAAVVVVVELGQERGFPMEDTSCWREYALVAEKEVWM